MKDKEIKIGIVLVNYNGYQLTEECLDSLYGVEDNIKIYIVDNKSVDGSYEKLQAYIYEKKYNNVIVIKNNRNIGFAGGNNIAIRQSLAEGMDYIILLNNDTIVDKDFIKNLIQPFKKYKDCYATVSKIYYECNKNVIWYAGGAFSYDTGKVVHWRYGESEDGRQEDIQKVTFATGCCLCLSKECIQEVGLLCEDYFLYDEDTDYCLQILNSNHSIYYVPKSIIYHKVNASTKKKKGLIDYYMTRNRIILIKKYIKQNKVKACIISELTYFYRCLKGEMSIKYFIKGSIDGIKNKMI